MRFKFKILLVFVLPLCIVEPAFTQEEGIQSLAKQIESYQSYHLQEKLFLHVDKSFYVNGETIWFKVYAVDGSMHRPFNLSKVAYVELLDQESNAVLKAKVALDHGSGAGSFIIPASINSGNYLLRAYTNWMKNFSPDYFFNRQVTVVNDLRKLAPVAEKLSPKVDVEFFPEGGHLLRDAESKVAFKVTRDDGRGIDCHGYILNQHNDTISRFKSHKFGIGNFLFTPVTGDHYRGTIITSDGKSISKALPETIEVGYVLRLTNETDEELEFTVFKTGSNVSESPKLCYLLGHARGITKVAEARVIKDGKALFTIEKGKIGEGINHFTVFDEHKKPLSERLYFKAPESILKIELQKEKDVFALRERIDLNIHTKSEKENRLSSDLSLSVFLLDSLEKSDQATIQSYLWLSSDLRGQVESPGYYFERNDEETKAALDNLMLTHGWSRFHWEDVFSYDKPFFKYVPERRGILVQGKLIDKTTNKPASDVTAYLSVPGEKVNVFGAKSGKDGQLIFSVRDFYGANEVVVQTDFSKDSIYSIELFESFSEQRPSAVLPQWSPDRAVAHSLLRRSVNSQVTKGYWNEKNNSYQLLTGDSLPFYAPDKTYLLDEFTRFTSIEEVMREYVPEVGVRMKRGKFGFYMIDFPHEAIFKNEPLILLDNVPVFDTEKMLAINPLLVRKLEIVSRRYFNGPINSEGIVSFTSYDGKLAGYEIDPKALYIDYEGIQQQKEFYSPTYENSEVFLNRIPDRRNLLYWNPHVTTDENGQSKQTFYTSDVAGRYGVLIQGISKDAHSGSRFVTFEVKKNSN